jgi:hypothetical protein
MADQNSPRLVADERETEQALLWYQRESFARKVEGVDERATRESPVASGTTLLWLTKHMTTAEMLWLAPRFAGEPITVVPSDAVQPGDTIAAAVDAYRATWTRTDAIVAAASSLEAECAQTGDESSVNLHWVLMHLCQETRATRGTSTSSASSSTAPPAASSRRSGARGTPRRASQCDGGGLAQGLRPRLHRCGFDGCPAGSEAAGSASASSPDTPRRS